MHKYFKWQKCICVLAFPFSHFTFSQFRISHLATRVETESWFLISCAKNKLHKRVWHLDGAVQCGFLTYCQQLQMLERSEQESSDGWGVATRHFMEVHLGRLSGACCQPGPGQAVGRLAEFELIQFRLRSVIVIGHLGDAGSQKK